MPQYKSKTFDAFVRFSNGARFTAPLDSEGDREVIDMHLAGSEDAVVNKMMANAKVVADYHYETGEKSNIRSVFDGSLADLPGEDVLYSDEISDEEFEATYSDEIDDEDYAFVKDYEFEDDYGYEMNESAEDVLKDLSPEEKQIFRRLKNNSSPELYQQLLLRLRKDPKEIQKVLKFGKEMTGGKE